MSFHSLNPPTLSSQSTLSTHHLISTHHLNSTQSTLSTHSLNPPTLPSSTLPSRHALVSCIRRSSRPSCKRCWHYGTTVTSAIPRPRSRCCEKVTAVLLLTHILKLHTVLSYSLIISSSSHPTNLSTHPIKHSTHFIHSSLHPINLSIQPLRLLPPPGVRRIFTTQGRRQQQSQGYVLH